eukprot:s7191_g6.t1
MDSRTGALRAREKSGASDPQQHSGGKSQPLSFPDKLLMLNALVEGSEIEKDSDAVAILVPRPFKMHHSFKTDVECSATRKRGIVPKQVTGVPDPVCNQAACKTAPGPAAKKGRGKPGAPSIQAFFTMAAGEGKGIQPDPAQPTEPKGKGEDKSTDTRPTSKGKGQQQNPSHVKGKGKGKNPGQPYASRGLLENGQSKMWEAGRFCAKVVWHGIFKVRWATHSESTASVSLIPAILQERVELATTFLGLHGVDSKGAVEFLTYSTVVLTVLRATGLELMDTGASNLGINSAAVPQPKVQLFDLGSWYLVRPPKAWVSTLLQECQSYREVLIEQGILLSDGSLDLAIGQVRAQ